ncbi:Unknown protein [Striga hermonthica]|uniref:Uncharacterized protein n=1 Tax=Striga hermonthica TaxID=68872 RepID=A0A9N7MXI3_STRHE|nr:Unknown protein [Striga hermonthica]
MATAVVEPPRKRHITAPMTLAGTKPRRVCFSYAAYTKNLIDYLISSNVPVEPGLSDAEVTAVETAFRFAFPPDLRSILQEGLPVGPGFPNWRSSSKQQLEIAINLPIMGICKEVSRNGLWIGSWGDRPEGADRAVNLARDILKKSPILVPIYRRFYIPAAPSAAGNPVFYVHGGDVRLWSFDISGFFQQVELRVGVGEQDSGQRRVSSSLAVPAWAAKEARRVEFWTDLAAEEGEALRGTRGWWSGDLGGCLEKVCGRLRGGGWREEEIREMMTMDGCDDGLRRDGGEPMGVGHVERLRMRLLGAGWSSEDVEEALGKADDEEREKRG